MWATELYLSSQHKKKFPGYSKSCGTSGQLHSESESKPESHSAKLGSNPLKSKNPSEELLFTQSRYYLTIH